MTRQCSKCHRQMERRLFHVWGDGITSHTCEECFQFLKELWRREARRSAHKTCVRCEEYKPLSSFHLYKGKPQSWCSECMRVYAGRQTQKLKELKQKDPQALFNELVEQNKSKSRK